MSYDIVKGLKIDTKNGIVKIKSASSNVFPKYFTWWECESLSTMLQEQGKEEVIKTILVEYWNGNFQKSNNVYEKSLILFDFKRFNWDNTNGDSRTLRNALYDAYRAYLTRVKGKFIVEAEDVGYVVKFLKNGYRYSQNKSMSQVFTSKEDAMIKTKDYNSTFTMHKIG